MEATATRKNNHGVNVRRWREWRGINQDVLAERVGVSQATFSGYENKETLEPEVIEKIAKALDVPIEAITEVSDGTSINFYSGTWEGNSAGLWGNSYVQNQNQSFNPIDKVIELYERLLKASDDKVVLMKEILKDKK